jgi:hypothetical protein
MALTLEIDRTTDIEVSITTCFIDGVKINENYYFDLSVPDGQIDTDVRADLIIKGYTI